MADLQPAFARLAAAAAGLPEVEQSTWYGTPALKVRGKGFARVKDADTVVLMASLEDKEMLFAAAPDIYFETDHYRGWPAMLVRIHAIGDDELARRLSIAWALKAPKALLRQSPQG
ncbi:MAG: MmcQ/YjbR family DNA-binding protein [Rhizobiaceae bacterium]